METNILHHCVTAHDGKHNLQCHLCCSSEGQNTVEGFFPLSWNVAETKDGFTPKCFLTAGHKATGMDRRKAAGMVETLAVQRHWLEGRSEGDLQPSWLLAIN